MPISAADRRNEGDTILRKVQLTELFLLDIFVGICKKHNLVYILDAGTLLGAMRHDGFIPWDDDIDVCMPWKDYKKFISIAAKELPPEILMQVPGQYLHNDAASVRLRDCRSFCCEAGCCIDQPAGIFIDVFPLVHFPKLPFGFAKLLMRAAVFCRLNRVGNKVAINKYFFQYFKHALMDVVWLIASGVIHLFYYILRVVRPFVWNKEFGGIVFCPSGFEDSKLFPVRTHTFEGKEYSIPNDPDYYLTTIYGDWHEIPPPSKRGGEHQILYVSPTEAPNVKWAKKD